MPISAARATATTSYAAAGPVDARTTSSGSKRYSSAATAEPESCATSSSITMRPIGSIGCRTVVSGGSMLFIRAESSKPTTETSCGTRSPARRTARIAPSASGSDAQMTPVTPAASSRAVAA